MSFELAHKIKSKAGDSKTGTITKSSSFGNPHTNANLIKGSFNHILYLQRTIGNQAIMQPGRSENDNLTGFGFARMSIQPKLKISRPDDTYEQEADRVAEQVMRISGQTEDVRVQRNCPRCSKGLQGLFRIDKGDEKLQIQPKETPGKTPEVTSQTEAKISTLRDGGQPLPESTRALMEQRLGHDFSRVRIHADTQAAESARALNSLAYTVGADVFFDAGQYRPTCAEGQRLLAHELAHVVQQTTTGLLRVQRQARGEARPPFLSRTIPRRYKGIEIHPWAGLPEVLYPAYNYDHDTLERIHHSVDQMARIRFDAQTIQNRSSGERRLRQNAPEWSSSFVKDRVLGPGVPTLAELETEHQRLRDYVLSEIASIKTTELRKFLSQRIHVVLPPFRYVVGAVRLRRAERLAPYIPFRQDKIIRLLLQHSSSF